MSKIHVKYMSDATLETLRANIGDVTNYFISHPNDNSWIDEISEEETYVEKRLTIEDFDLLVPSDAKDRDVDFKNSITLYEHLKDLPKYVLTDERFWNWINFDKAYSVALAMMPIQENSAVFKDHWLFTQGRRRGLFFGVMSRSFYRVALTVDDDPDQKYSLTRFVIDNPERFRNLSWRAFSSEKHIVRGVLKAEKRVYDETAFEKNAFYPEIAKYVSQLGSVMLIDAMEEQDIQKYVYERLKTMVEEEIT